MIQFGPHGETCSDEHQVESDCGGRGCPGPGLGSARGAGRREQGGADDGRVGRGDDWERGLRDRLVDFREALEAIQPSVARTTVNEALDEVERARHEARRATFALGLEQGMSIGELGRAWGFSRQLAARYAKEVNSGD